MSHILRRGSAWTARCCVLLVFLSVSTVSAAPVVGTPDVTVVSADANATILEFSFPVTRTAGEAEPLLDSDLVWAMPRPQATQEDGSLEPLPYAAGAMVAVPTRDALGWDVLGATWIVDPLETVSAREAVHVGAPRVFRDVPLASVSVEPELGGGVLGTLTVRLSHAPRGRYATALARSVDKTATDVLGERVVVNPELFTRLRGGLRVAASREKAGRQELTPFELSENWLRVEIAETGVHEVSGYDFLLASVNMVDVDAEKLRVFRALPTELVLDPETEPATWQPGYAGLVEVPCEIDDTDENWDSGDALRFYAVGPDDWADRFRDDAEPLDWQQHPYSDHTAYWITWEDHLTSSPHAGSPLRLTSTDAAASGADPVAIHLGRQHREEDTVEAFGRLLDDWAWDLYVDNSRTVDFQVENAVVDSAAFYVAEVRIKHLSSTGSSTEAHAGFWLNDGAATGDSLDCSWTILEETRSDSLHVRFADWCSNLQEGTNLLTVRRFTDSEASWLILDSADLLAWRELVHDGGQLPIVHWGHQVAAAGQAVDLVLSYTETSAPRVWDVSDPESPVELDGTIVGAPTRTLTLGLTRDPDSDRHLIAFSRDELLEPVALEKRDPGALRAVDPDVDYVIIHHPDLAVDAARLETRRARTLDVLRVDTEGIYDAFGGGVKDPLALRNFLKWLYTQGEGALSAVCLVGDASRDYRDRQQTQFPDLVPTYIRSYFPDRYTSTNHAYSVDDQLVSFDSDVGLVPDIADLAIGRLTVRDADEARTRIDGLLDFELQPPEGLWRNRVVMVADDLCQPSDTICDELFHMEQTEHLVDTYLPSSVDVSKVYLADYAYDSSGIYKPGARQDARDLWNEGLAIFLYIGHGSENTLADEQVFLTDDIYAMTNGGKRGVFMAFSCDVGVFDSATNQSMAEIFVSQESGGAIASIAASQVSYVGPNEMLSDAFFSALYPDRRVVADVSLGQALLQAKIAMEEQRASYIVNSQRYHLFCDPVVVLPTPAAGPEFHATSVDTLRGGWREEVVCVLSDNGLSAGAGTTYDLSVREDREEKVAQVDYASAEYWLPGATVFHGSGTADADTLRIPFKVPVQLSYGDAGRVRLIVSAPEGDYAVAQELPVVQAATGEVDDVVGPSIELAFADGRYRVKAGTLLQATVSDTSGVSILGTTPLNSLLLTFDDSDFQSDVSENFVFDSGSYTSGSIAVELPDDLELGAHTAALLASDVLGNVGSDTVSFQLVAGDQVAIDDVTLFPNPTSGPARLIFELSDPMTVRWTIFTLAGHRIYSQTRNFSTAGPQVMHWDGRDDAGDELANGVYLFVLKGFGFDDEGHRLDVSGKLVVMK